VADPEEDKAGLVPILLTNELTAIVSDPLVRVNTTVPFTGNDMLNVASFSPPTVNGAAENEEDPNTLAPPVVVLFPLVGTVTVPAMEDRETVPKFNGVLLVFSMVIGAITFASIPMLLKVEETCAYKDVGIAT